MTAAESTSDALDYLRADRVPEVQLAPHIDADAVIVMAAADHVEEMLPHTSSDASVPDLQRTGSTIFERLEPRTFEQMKELMRWVV